LTTVFCFGLPTDLLSQSRIRPAKGGIVVEIRPEAALQVRFVPPPKNVSTTAAEQWLQVDVKLRLDRDASALLSIEQEVNSTPLISGQINSMGIRILPQSKLTEMSLLTAVTLMTIEKSGQHSVLLSLPKGALEAQSAKNFFVALRSSDGLLYVRNRIVNPTYPQP
jgi:hypothetical protein